MSIVQWRSLSTTSTDNNNKLLFLLFEIKLNKELSYLENKLLKNEGGAVSCVGEKSCKSDDRSDMCRLNTPTTPPRT